MQHAVPSKQLYCPNCKIHTAHTSMVQAYVTVCMGCNAHTSELIRQQAESHHYRAPDGTDAVVVEHTPSKVVYFIPVGEYAGYYEYDMRTKQKIMRSLQ